MALPASPVQPVSPQTTQDPAYMKSSYGTSVGGQNIQGSDPRVDAEIAAWQQKGTTISRDIALANVLNGKDLASQQQKPGTPPTPTSNPVPTPTPPSTQSTSTTTPAPSKTANNDIVPYLNQGYANVDDIARASGLSPEEVQKQINNDADLSFMFSQNVNQNKVDSAFNDYKAQVDSIKNGTFTLTPAEQAQVDNINKMYDEIKKKQLTANQNYQGGVQAAEIRTGRQEFMNEISTGTYHQAVQDGIDKITKIDQENLQAVNDLQAAFRQNRLKDASEMYDALQENLQKKSDEITKIHEATMKMYDEQNKAIKADQEAQKALDNQEKLKSDQSIKLAGELAPSLAASLTGVLEDDKTLIEDVAKHFEIDPILLQANIQEYTDKAKEKTTAADTKFEQSLLTKGYRTISPADVARMRAAGNDVIESGGKAYMKEAPTKIITIGAGKSAQKVVVDAKGNIIKKVGGGTMSSAPVASSGTTKKTASSGGTEKQAIAEMTKVLGSVTGSDGYISPQDYQSARKQWVDAGLSATTFDTKFKGYRNPNNLNYVTNKQ